MSQTVKGYLAASLSTLIIGFSFMFLKVALEREAPLVILADRFTIAAVTMLPVALIRRKEISLSFRKMFLFIPIAILYPIIFFSMQTLGMNQAITSSEAGVVQSTAPICILLLAYFSLKEKITLAQLIFTLLSVLGVMLILFAKGININMSHAKGVLLILVSVLGGAMNNILIRKYRNDFTTFEITLFSILLGFFAFNAINLASCHVTNAPWRFFIQSDSVLYIAALMYLGTFSSLGSSFLTNYALSKIKASNVGVFGNLVIVVALFAGKVFMDEQLSVLHLAGALLIFIGVLGANVFGRR